MSISRGVLLDVFDNKVMLSPGLKLVFCNMSMITKTDSISEGCWDIGRSGDCEGLFIKMQGNDLVKSVISI